MECDGNSCVMRPSNTKSTAPFPLPTEGDEWTVYGASYCRFCTQSKELLIENNQEYTYHDVDAFGGAGRVKLKLRKLIGDHYTIPIIFHHNEFVGGYDKLKKRFVKPSEGIFRRLSRKMSTSKVYPEPKMKEDVTPDTENEGKGEEAERPMPGGLTVVHTADDTVQEIVDNLFVDIVRDIPKEVDKLTATHYRTQLVAGTNFFIKARVGSVDSEEFVHVRVFRPLPHTEKPPEVVKVSYPHTEEEVITSLS